jgi:hypothetical protein
VYIVICEEEQFPIKEWSCAIVRQAVDCSAWERSLLDPAGKDFCGVGSKVRKVRECSTRDSDVSVCRKILEQVGVWLDWVSGSNVGWSRISSVGLKLGRCRISSAVLRRPRCRDGFRKLGFKSNSKKAKRLFSDQVCGLDEARLDAGMSGLGSSAPEAVDGSISTLPLDSGSKGFEFPSLGADALGERIRLSLPMMADSGAPIYPFETKSVMRYQRKSKAKASKLDISLIDEAVTALSSPMTQCLGTS